MKKLVKDICDKPIASVRPKVLRTTLLELVQTVQDFTTSDRETVRLIAHLINSGRVILSGTFSGVRLLVADGSWRE